MRHYGFVILAQRISLASTILKFSNELQTNGKFTMKFVWERWIQSLGARKLWQKWLRIQIQQKKNSNSSEIEKKIVRCNPATSLVFSLGFSLGLANTISLTSQFTIEWSLASPVGITQHIASLRQFGDAKRIEPIELQLIWWFRLLLPSKGSFHRIDAKANQLLVFWQN